jgi:hypothetical protein
VERSRGGEVEVEVERCKRRGARGEVEVER